MFPLGRVLAAKAPPFPLALLIITTISLALRLVNSGASSRPLMITWHNWRAGMVFVYGGPVVVVVIAAAIAAQLLGAAVAVPAPVPIPLACSSSSRIIYRISFAMRGPGFMAGAMAVAMAVTISVAVIAGWPWGDVLVRALDSRERIWNRAPGKIQL